MGRPRRYLNQPVERGGIKFASKTESRRYRELELLQRAGHITELRPHPNFDIVVNGQKVCTYIGDAEYVQNGARVVEDTKSPRTRTNPTYRLKAKLMRACHGIEIREVTA